MAHYAHQRIPAPAPECSAYRCDADRDNERRQHRNGVDHAPTFTAEDERRERAGLTARDMCEIEADLRGLVLDDKNNTHDDVHGARVHDCVGATTSTRPGAGGAASTTRASSDAGSLLSRLGEEMNQLEREFHNHAARQSTTVHVNDNDTPSTVAYRRAQTLCPDQLTDDRLLAFLDTEKGDAARAARRLARYWNYRLDLFGESRCYRPMTLLPGGAMAEEVENLSVRRIFEPLPGSMTDEAGRTIVHCVPSRRNFAEYSVAQEMQALFYICETIVQDAKRRRAGLVVVMDGRNMRRQHFSRDMARYSNIFKDVLPVKMRAHHLCHPSAVHYYVIVPASKFLSPRESRLRFVMHCGSEEQVLNELSMYRLPRHCVPTTLGGTAVLDMNQWVLDRLVTEQREAVMATATAAPIPSEAVPPSPSPLSMCADGLFVRQDGSPFEKTNGPMTKRVRVGAPSSGAAVAGMGPSLVSHSDAKKLSRPRGKGAGRGRSDPRMDRAIMLKIADPDMALMDALVGGGFVFDGIEDGEVIDTDGVRLTQRKNNLVRRIRLEKKKIKEEDVEKRRDGTESDQTTYSGRESGSSMVAENTQSLGKNAFEQNDSDGVGHVATDFSIANKSRSDSFDEAILGLASIQDLIKEERQHSSV